VGVGFECMGRQGRAPQSAIGTRRCEAQCWSAELRVASAPTHRVARLGDTPQRGPLALAPSDPVTCRLWLPSVLSVPPACPQREKASEPGAPKPFHLVGDSALSPALVL